MVELCSTLADFDDPGGGFRRGLVVYGKNDDFLGVEMVENAPVVGFVADAQLVTTRSDIWHGTGVRQAKAFTLLQKPEQHPGLDPGRQAERRALDFALHPDERLVSSGRK